MDESTPQGELTYSEVRRYSVEGYVKKLLPAYSHVDSAEYDSYDPSADENDRGQILYFHTEVGRGEATPQVWFIFRPNGFTLNYYDTPEPSTNYTIRNKSNSLYGRRQAKWQIEEVEFALERARIHMEGIDHTSQGFLIQPVGFSEDGSVVTMEERMLVYQSFKGKGKSFKQRFSTEWESTKHTIWDLFDKEPEKAAELAILRIQGMAEYVGLDGMARPVEDVVNDIRENTEYGKKAVLREMYIIESYERLLKDRQLL